jgi:hypothetical protein
MSVKNVPLYYFRQNNRVKNLREKVLRKKKKKHEKINK